MDDDFAPLEPDPDIMSYIEEPPSFADYEFITAGKRRPDWDTYFLSLCDAVATRADCSRRRVGAVLVSRAHRVLATGYNGTWPGGPSCLAGQCPRANSNAKRGEGYAESNCIATHAESNCIMFAGFEKCAGATIYVNAKPCVLCEPLIRSAGITRIVYKDDKTNGSVIIFYES